MHKQLKQYARRLGYTLTDEDCQEIIETWIPGETVSHAVRDFLSAYETPELI